MPRTHLPDRRCKGCKRRFKPGFLSQQYCSKLCSRATLSTYSRRIPCPGRMIFR